MRLRVPLAAALVLSGSAVVLAGHDWKQRLGALPTTDDSNERIAEVRSVEPNDKGAVGSLMNVLALRDPARMDAHIRMAAVERLAAATDPKAVDEVAKYLASKDARVREGAALALGRLRAKKHFAALAKLVDDPDAGVRRAALRALRDTGDLAAVDVLLRRWEKIDKAKDREFREVLLLADGLEKLTERSFGRHLDRWQELWAAQGAGYKRPSEMTEEERKAADAKEKYKIEDEKKGETTTTTVREMPISVTKEGRGPIPLLVIPDDSWKPDYVLPYLSSLEDVCQIYVVRLPRITEVPIKKRNIGGFPYWPYDELCDAFDEIRKKEGHEKFAVLAHGFSTMIGMRFLGKHPEAVSHMILVGSFPGDDNYGKLLDRLQARATTELHDKELNHAVMFHWITDEKTFTYFYMPKSNPELEALDRRFFSLMFADPQDPEIAELWERVKNPASTDLAVMKKEQCETPPFDIMREKHPDVPVLVVSGAKSLWFGEQDGLRVSKNYPVSEHVVLKSFAMMPWFEENGAFTDAVKEFLKKHPAGKK